MYQTLIKAALSVAIILIATAIGKRYPSMAGLVGVMPLTGALVLVWLYLENKGNPAIMQECARGALWGMIPSLLFFAVAFYCFRKQVSLTMVLVACFGTWFIAACVHQWFLRY